jgi:hypothetical protein
VQALAKQGAVGPASIEDFTSKLNKPRAVWMMVPAAAVDPTLNTLVPLLEHGDPTLFAREDAVEASWRIVDPVLDGATRSSGTIPIAGDRPKRIKPWCRQEAGTIPSPKG